MNENIIEWDYNKVYERISSYVLESEPVRAVLLFDALSKREGKDVQTGLKQIEWSWLQWNLGFMKRVLNNHLLSTMIFLTHKSGWSSFHTRELAKKTGSTEAQICRYARELESKNLLKRHKIQYDKRVYYVASTDLPSINRILIEMVVTKHGLTFFTDYLKPTEQKIIRHSQFMRRVNETVKRHYKNKGRS